MPNLFKRIEVLANVAIVIVAILLGVVLVKQLAVAKRNQPTTRPASARKELAAGEKINVAGMEWAKNGHTLLLVLQKGCRFCNESAAFYQRLIKQTSSRNDLKLVALLPQPVAEGKQYLNELGVNIDDVRQISPSQVNVGGTPTLILVNDSGVVVDVWSGKLPSEVESKVLSKL